MFPFIDLKIIKIPMYGLCILLGIAAAVFIAYKIIGEKEKFWNFIIVAVVTFSLGFVGAKILFILVSYKPSEYFSVVKNMLFSKGNPGLNSGFVFYGGILFGLAGYFLGLKIAGYKFFSDESKNFINILALITPLVHGFGRIGCFCAGCCYGRRYDGIFSVVYKNPVSDVQVGVGIFPVQLLESALLFALFFLFWFLYRRNRIIFPFYLIFYSLIRFFTEFLRGDVARGKIGMFSTSQFISLILFFIGIAFVIFYKTRHSDLSKI